MKGWQKKKLGDLAEIRMCKRIFAEQTSSNGEVPFFKIGTFGKEPDAYISYTLYNDFRSKYSFPEKGDILLSAAGTLGRAVTYDGKPSYFQDSNIVWLEIDKNQLCNEYLYYCYQMIVWASPEGSTISRLYNGIIRDTDILLPPLPEQQAIAATLSDVDGYISTLERLIAKKRDIKKGVMQELLTGKRRLPGFSGEWEEKALGKIADEIIMGQSPDSCFYNDTKVGLPLVQGNADIENRRTVIRFYSSYVTKLGKKGDIIMTVRAPVGSVAKADSDCCLGRGVCAIRANDYLYQLLVYFEPQWGAMSTGSTFDSISGEELRKVLFTVPISIAEQTAIASILSDMDAEIDALTAELAKVQNIKQGMMQELLTGRIRLVAEAEEIEGTPISKSAAKVINLPKRKSQPATVQSVGHNRQFDDAVMIAGIVDVLYSDRFRLGRKKVQKCLYLLRRHQDESTAAFKKKAAGPYADEVRYKGGEPIACKAKYITATVSKQGTTFARGSNISQALGYIQSWGKQADIKWVADNLRFKKVDELELLATVDMAICDLEDEGIPVSVASIKHLIATNVEWKAKLKRQTFSDDNIACAIKELQTLLQGGN